MDKNNIIIDNILFIEKRRQAIFKLWILSDVSCETW